jgi:rod shape-determining protein MreD
MTPPLHVTDSRTRRARVRPVPFLCCIVLLVLETLTVPLPGVGPVGLSLVLSGVIFWSSNRRHLLPLWFLLPLGLVQDVLGGTVLGLHALALLWASHRMERLHAGGEHWHDMRREGFYACALILGILLVVTAVLQERPIFWQPLVLQYLLSVFLFPILWQLQDGIYPQRDRWQPGERTVHE